MVDGISQEATPTHLFRTTGTSVELILGVSFFVWFSFSLPQTAFVACFPGVFGLFTEIEDMLNDTFLPTCVSCCNQAFSQHHCSKRWPLLEAGGFLPIPKVTRTEALLCPQVSSYEAYQVGPLCWPTDETLGAHLRFVLQAREFRSIDMLLPTE